MRNYQRCTIIFFVLIIGLSLSVAAQNEQVSWSADAEQIYDTGFMHMLKKHPNGSVSLFNFDLIENDSPGAGRSDKGNAIDSIWGKIRARKILMFDDQRALKSWLYIFPDRHNKHPLHVEINGHKTQFDVISRKGWETVRWIEFPVEWLKKGKNVIDLYCPEAQTEDEAWELQLARADEYEAGGGDPLPVGETSFKSFNDGKSWEQSPFGLEKKDRAEYCVRISLERFVQNGWLESPVIDLWRINSTDLIARMKTIQKLGFSALSDVPEGTTVTYCLRKGTSPSPFSDEWEPYEEIGSGRSVTYDIEGGKYNRRYLQFKVILATDNPLVTPVVKSAEISAEFKESFPVPRHKNIYVIEQNNPPILYSSVKWEWEKWDRPELTKLRKQENLDNVIAGSRTQLEKQMKLLDYAKKRWRWTNPSPEYPEWDALSIVERINKAGGGGMCIQQNLFFVGLCMTYGWQGRLIGVDGHEVCEVWNDDYGKWIYFDAFFPNHILCDIDTGEPLSFLEIHDRYLDYFYSDRPMDWATDYRYGLDAVKAREDKPPVLRSSLTYHDHEQNAYTGFMESRIMRMMPRNNFYEKPFPRPLAHFGGGYFWQGYINWYDDRTPVRGQYRWYTNRVHDMWPDMNTVHIDVTQGYGNDRLFLEFETYTPNFSHYEANTDDKGWEEVPDKWTWLLVPGKNKIQVRTVNKLGSKGKSSTLVVNHVVMPLNEWNIK